MAEQDPAPQWLTDAEMAAWLPLVALVELLPNALDTQLRTEARLSHFDYTTLAMLSEAPERTLQMSALARRTNSTLPRLSHVITRLAERGLVMRRMSEQDARAKDVTLTSQGWDAVVDAAPGHVRRVRTLVMDALTPEQIDQLSGIADAVLGRLDPEQRFSASATAVRPGGVAV